MKLFTAILALASASMVLAVPVADNEADTAAQTVKLGKEKWISPGNYVWRRDQAKEEWISPQSNVYRRSTDEANEVLSKQNAKWINPQSYVFRRSAAKEGDEKDGSKVLKEQNGKWINPQSYTFRRDVEGLDHIVGEEK